MSGHVTVIAEAGVNHNGSFDAALALCDEAKRCGADIVKFQTWKTDLLITRDAPLADYQKANISAGQTQYDMLKALELSYEQFVKIKNHCENIGIQFLSTADEPESLHFLVNTLKLDTIKVGSSDIGNVPMLRAIGQQKCKVLLSTGMAGLGEIEQSIMVIEQSGTMHSNITLLHCTTEYPAPYSDINLKAIPVLKNTFGVPVGYSDHTIGIEISLAAVALGAVVIEKHFTLDKAQSGPDHRASIDPRELSQLVTSIRNIELALGDGIKRVMPCEMSNKRAVQKVVVANAVIAPGEVFTGDNLTTKRSATGGIHSSMWNSIVGRKSSRRYQPDMLIEW